MPKDKPTQEELKKFWEWCGFRLDDGGDFKWWYKPEGDHLPLGEEPALDLNNLFQNAVPKAIDRIMIEQDGCSSDVAYAVLFKRWLAELELDMQHPDLTLYKVLRQVMEVDND